MKKIVITLVAVFALGIFSSSAQDMAHINYQKVMDTLNTYKRALAIQEDIDAVAQEKAKYLQETLQNDLAVYQQNANTMTDIEREITESNLQTLQGKLQAVEQQYAIDMQTVETRYYVPLEEWLREAVGIVGEAKKVDYILYYNEGGIFWVNPNKGVDLTNEVITELLKLEAANPILAPGE